MLNGITNGEIAKHFEFSEMEIVKLVEIWKHFYPMDNPEFTDSNHTIKVNIELGIISTYTFAHLIKFQLTENLGALDKYTFKTEVLLTERITDWLFEKYIILIKN